MSEQPAENDAICPCSDPGRTHSADLHDHSPERIGYADPWQTTEFGVFEDRRSAGLGFALVQTTESREHALEVIARPSEFPRFLRQRVVVYQPWARIFPPTDRGADIRPLVVLDVGEHDLDELIRYLEGDHHMGVYDRSKIVAQLRKTRPIPPG